MLVQVVDRVPRFDRAGLLLLQPPPWMRGLAYFLGWLRFVRLGRKCLGPDYYIPPLASEPVHFIDFWHIVTTS